MEGGVIVEEGPSREFFSTPKQESTRRFLRRVLRDYDYTI